MTDLERRAEDLLVRYLAALAGEGPRFDPVHLCGGDAELLAALLVRITKYEEIDALLSKRRRLSPGRRLGGYEIVAEIGRGSMGIVYLARRLEHGDRVALKLFPPERGEDAELVARFEREARVIRRLDHPNIVKLHSIEEIDDLRFLTMDYVEGETLASALPANGFSLDAILAIAVPLANALASVHREGIIHRDLKLSNLMWTRERGLRVLDFGVVRLLGETSESLTRTGSVVGTITAMSPEQLMGEPADARSDLYSFGVVLHQLATGSPPFAGRTLAQLIHAVLERDPEPLPVDIGGLGEVVDGCLRKDPARRPQSFDQVEAMLRALPSRGDRSDLPDRIARRDE
jgi:serine/threonine protein kinase